MKIKIYNMNNYNYIQYKLYIFFIEIILVYL